MRKIDRLTTERYGTPSLRLMEAAATATARVVTERLSGDMTDKSVLVLCGKGNNGGDGAATGRLLALAGARVDARDNFKKVRSVARFHECSSATEWAALTNEWSAPYDVYVDALFGTGL